ncbi:MAG: hypothetical protein ACI83L_003024, partial [Cryomorphaceae bacterium]
LFFRSLKDCQKNRIKKEDLLSFSFGGESNSLFVRS